MSLISKYFEDTKKYKLSHGEKTIILIQVGSFFECYATIESDGSYVGSSIEEFSRICDMSIARKNTCVGNKKVVMAGFGLTQLEKYKKIIRTWLYSSCYKTKYSSKECGRFSMYIFSWYAF